MAIRVQCPAKVNLFLEITGRRPDGYHRLATLFAKINLYDVLELEANDTGRIDLSVECEDGLGPLSAGPENLVIRAARGFFKFFRVGRGVQIKLIKRIPLGAGLGGGSSDAAGTLSGLAKLFDLKLDARTRAALRGLALGLGADVPFFFHPAPFCLATGIGERLKPLKIAHSLAYMVLVYPGFGVSTAKAYAALPKTSRSDVLTRMSQLDKLIKSLQKGRPISEWRAFLFNRLQEAGMPEFLQVERARGILTQLGVQGALMSGSGSSVFGFVSSHAEGERITKRLKAYPWRVYLTSCQG